jgi:hypothetical protein
VIGVMDRRGAFDAGELPIRSALGATRLGSDGGRGGWQCPCGVEAVERRRENLEHGRAGGVEPITGGYRTTAPFTCQL